MKASKKLIASIFALVVAGSLAATTTFAWFTMNDTVNLDNFEVTVTSVTPGLFVSTKEGVGYTTSLALGTYITDALDAYKTANANTDFKMKDMTYIPAVAEPAAPAKMTGETPTADWTHDMDAAYVAVTNADGYLTLPAAGVRTQDFEYNMLNGYLSFNLYFRGDGQYDLRLTENSKVTTAIENRPTTVNAYPWKDLSTFTTTYGVAVGSASSTTTTPLETRAAYAARVLFNTTPSLVATKGTTITNIWEPNEKLGFSEFRAGKLTPDSATPAVRNLAQDVKAILFGDATDANLLTAVTARFPGYTPTITDTKLANTAAAATSPVLVRLEQSGGVGAYYCKMSVSIWIEGWDEDCLNSILTDQLKVALEVKAYAV